MNRPAPPDGRRKRRRRRDSQERVRRAADTTSAGGDPPQALETWELHADPLNRAIINMLQEDGRLPYAKVAKALNVSEGTIRNRVNRLTEAGALRIIAVADPLVFGYTGYAMLGLKLAPAADPEAVAQRFADRPETTYVLVVAGYYDLLVEVISENQDKLREFIYAHCYRQPDIAVVEPMLALGMYKNLLKWGMP